jgi:hypothetical protein
LIVADDEDPDGTAREKFVPVPVKATVRGLPGAPSLIVKAPVREPVNVGVNDTAIVQLSPMAMFVPQAFVCAKSPLTEMAPIANGAFPVFERTTVCTLLVVPTSWFANVRPVEERCAIGWIPVPVSVTVCGFSGASSAIVSTDAWSPISLGVNLTLMVQWAPTERVAAQSFV